MKKINIKCVFTGSSKELALHTHYHAVQHPFNENSFILSGIKDAAGFPLSFSKNHFIVI